MSILNALPDKKTFELTARQLGISDAFVEKDWYVTQVIGILSKINHHGFQMVFSGGTELSKAHRLIQRFSEDIDFRVLVPETSQTRKLLSAFRHVVLENLRDNGFPIEEHQVKSRNENRFFTIDIDYNTAFSREDALRSHIQIEMTVINQQLPAINLPVASFVTELTKRPPEVEKIACIDPAESAADKLSALAWRVPDRVRGSYGDDPSMVRHIHDLAILKNVALKHPQFPSLVIATTKDDNNRSKNNPSFASLTLGEKFNQMLSMLASDAEYSKEYDRFVKGVSYAELPPDFETAVEAVKLLVRKVLD